MYRISVFWASGRVMDLLMPAATTGLAVVCRIEEIDPAPLLKIRQHLPKVAA